MTSGKYGSVWSTRRTNGRTSSECLIDTVEGVDNDKEDAGIFEFILSNEIV
jgi:hypothetical protein